MSRFLPSLFVQLQTQLYYLEGIRSVRNDIEKVQLASAFGWLNEIVSLFSTSKGKIEFKLKRTKNKPSAKITIPRHYE